MTRIASWFVELLLRLHVEPCDYMGHRWMGWISYRESGRTRDWPEWHTERGEVKTCESCGCSVYRNVEWTQEETVDTRPWESKEERPW